MFRAILFVGLLSLSTIASAGITVDSAKASNTPNPCLDIATSTKGKSTAEIATILESCRSAPSANLLPEVTAEEANNWADASKSFASAIAVAAKELGIAVNDFLDSPAGWILAGLLIFNYAGETIVGILIGAPFMFLAFFVWYKITISVMRDDIKYEYIPYLWGAFKIKRLVSYTTHWGENAIFTSVVAFIGIFAVTAIFLANIA